MRRLAVIVLVVAGAAVAIVVVGPFGGSDDSRADSANASAGSVATVQQGRLASQVSESGTLGYEAQADGSPWPVVNHASGAYTSLPTAGDVRRCGHVLYRVENEPVMLLCGRTPIYRSLAEGMSGPDVRELNRNLVDLGYASTDDLDPDSDDFSSQTEAALRDLQDHLDVDATGTLEPSAVAVLPSAARITKVTATLGTPARPGAPMAQATATRRQVEVDLEASEAASVKVGDRAQVTLPSNATTSGTVSDVGTVAAADKDASSGADASAKIPVYIRLDHVKAVEGLDEAPVQVDITTAKVKDALSVPVTALIALAGGGYAVETVSANGARTRVPVQLGLFDHANGLVQVTGSGLAAGQKVAVPAT